MRLSAEAALGLTCRRLLGLTMMMLGRAAAFCGEAARTERLSDIQSSTDAALYLLDPPQPGGPVDTSISGHLVRKLLTASRGGTLPVMLDLTSFTRLASGGIHVLYQVREQLAAHGQNLTLLAAPGSSVALILELAHHPHATGTTGDPS